MKFILTFFVTLMLSVTPSMGQTEAANIILKINGMVCEACVESLKKVFGKEESVNAIDVNLETQTVTIDTKENQTITDEKIKELIEWGGYDLVSIQRN